MLFELTEQQSYTITEQLQVTGIKSEQLFHSTIQRAASTE